MSLELSYSFSPPLRLNYYLHTLHQCLIREISCRITPFGEPPTPRAAHVATAVGTMVVIQVAWKGYLIGYLNIAEFISFL